MNSRMIKINLLPQKQRIRIPKLPIGSIIGVAILLAYGYYLFVPMIDSTREEIDTLNQQLEKLKVETKKKVQDKERVKNDLQNQITEIKMKINTVKGLVTGADTKPWVKVLEALTQVTEFPKGSGVWITKFSVTADFRANISGVAENDWGVVSNFIEKLKADENFTDVNLDGAIKNFVDNGIENVPVYNFDITCRINKQKI